MKPESMAGRLQSLSIILHSLRTTTTQVEKMQQALLQSLHSICRIDGFDVTVTPQFNDAVDLIVQFVKKDHRQMISAAEREEILFRRQQVCGLGFKSVLTDEDQASHGMRLCFKVR